MLAYTSNSQLQKYYAALHNLVSFVTLLAYLACRSFLETLPSLKYKVFRVVQL